MDADLEQVIRSSELVVHPGRYAYLRCSARPAGDHFMVSKDQDEVTVVTEESKVPHVAHSDFTEWFRLLEIRVCAPFQAKGFLAAVANAVAGRGLNILLVSTYSKDYALVREETAETAIEALGDLGFPIRRS